MPVKASWELQPSADMDIKFTVSALISSEDQEHQTLGSSTLTMTS